jgi:hypothetical protein
MFKIGDSVRVKTNVPLDPNQREYAGKIGVISDNHKSLPGIKFPNNVPLVAFSFEKLEHANVSELEELVRRVNEGIAAVYKITNRPDKDTVEAVFSSGGIYKWNKVRCDFDIGTTLRIKQKTKFVFPEMKVAGHVTILIDEGKTVKVGCQVYPRKSLMEDLRMLTCGQSYGRDTDQYTLRATRNGVQDIAGSNVIVPWDQVEKLLKALEDYDRLKENE